MPGSLTRKYPKYDIHPTSYGDVHIKDWNTGQTLKIGAYCSFAEGVQIMLGGGHRTDWVSTYPFPAFHKEHVKRHPKEYCPSKGDVVIGNDVWIGTEAMILSGVTVGDGAVIGARAVVAKDVEPYSVVVGNPARVIKYRFTPEIIERLLELEWYHKDSEWIARNMDLICSDNVEGLLDLNE